MIGQGGFPQAGAADGAAGAGFGLGEERIDDLAILQDRQVHMRRVGHAAEADLAQGGAGVDLLAFSTSTATKTAIDVDAAMAGLLSWEARRDAISSGVTRSRSSKMLVF